MKNKRTVVFRPKLYLALFIISALLPIVACMPMAVYFDIYPQDILNFVLSFPYSLRIHLLILAIIGLAFCVAMAVYNWAIKPAPQPEPEQADLPAQTGAASEPAPPEPATAASTELTEPGAASGQAPPPTNKPRVPNRQSQHFTRWQATWRIIREKAEAGEPAEKIHRWLECEHKEQSCSLKTLNDIVKAGKAGKLD